MDTEELDDLIEDGDDVMDYRARAKTELDRIARQTKNALAEHGIDLTVFFGLVKRTCGRHPVPAIAAKCVIQRGFPSHGRCGNRRIFAWSVWPCC